MSLTGGESQTCINLILTTEGHIRYYSLISLEISSQIALSMKHVIMFKVHSYPIFIDVSH